MASSAVTAQSEDLPDGQIIRYDLPPVIEFAFRHITSSLRCRLLVSNGLSGRAPYSQRLELESASARESLKRALTDYYGAQTADWKVLCHEAASLAIALWQGRSHAADITTLALPPQDGFLITKILPLNQPTIFFGDGGCGKSLIAQDIGLCCTSHFGWLKDCYLTANAPLRVLYCDFEANRHAIIRRHQRLLQNPHKHCDPNRFFLWESRGVALADQIESLQGEVDTKKIDLVIVDSAGFAGGGRPEEAEVAIRFFNALNSLNITSLILAHQSKMAGNEGWPFGSSFWHNGARSIWRVNRYQDTDADLITLMLTQTKANNDSLSSPLGLEITFSPDNGPIILKDTDLFLTPELDARRGLKDRLLSSLRHSKHTVSELASLLNAKPKSIRDTLNRYAPNKKSPLFVSLGPADSDESLWGLFSHAQPPLP